MKGEIFEGNPCRKCQSTQRYRSTGACVKCQREHAAQQKLLKKQKVIHV